MSEEDLPPFAEAAIAAMRQSVRDKWMEAATTFFARAVINKDVAIACGEAGFGDAMIFFRNKAAWLLAQGLACTAESMKAK